MLTWCLRNYECASPVYVCTPQVRESLHQRAADFGIVLEDVAITHLSFGAEVRACLSTSTIGGLYQRVHGSRIP